MNEKLLQYIWQYQYFDKYEPRTFDGDLLEILSPGTLNHNQGPDFLGARIRIGDTTWVGDVELHVQSADWVKHGHDADENYNSVVLHVVWEYNGFASKQPSFNNIPLFELQGKVPGILLHRYEQLMQLSSFIPCESLGIETGDITWSSWKTRLAVERLERKSAIIGELLQKNNFHWEETCWWLLAKSFGTKVNADAFEAIARSIPYNVLLKLRPGLIPLEATLLGQSGLLNNRFRDHYPRMLQKEYRYQKNKFALKPVQLPVHFLRMRPENFPTIRLAQLAMLVHSIDHLFCHIKESASLEQLKKSMDLPANDYWHYHYHLQDESVFKIKKPGRAMINSIVINTICPLLFTYSKFHDEKNFREKTIDWLESTEAELNSAIKGFHKLGIKAKTAFDSQALLELKSRYCDERRCLECAIGNKILKKEKE